MSLAKTSPAIPQVKICGLTEVQQAVDVAACGVQAVGCVFFPKSPRHLSHAKAREICRALPSSVRRVGVFVDETADEIMATADACGLDAVQLHGNEPPETVDVLRREGLLVIKALFAARSPSLFAAENYHPSAFLVECGAGRLPGGNAEAWNWEQARPLADRCPLILAGGLNPANIVRAIRQGQPDAVDLSSGVESAPGIKDLAKVAALMAAVKTCRSEHTLREIF